MSASLNVVTNTSYNKSFIIDINSNYTIDYNPIQQTNVAVIENMILNVLLTTPGERPFQPQFGSGVPSLLFNSITQQNAYSILHDIFFSVRNFVPGVTVNVASSSVYADLSQGTYYIVLSYTILGLPGSVTSNLTLSSLQ